MLSEDHDKTRKKQLCHVCHTRAFCRLLLPAVLLRKLTNKGGRGQRNREEIGAGATWFFLRLRRSCARLDKTAMLRWLLTLVIPTGGHFACECVHPLNDNSVSASNLMGEIENLYKGTVLLKAISLVLWIPYFPTKNILHEINWTLSTRGFICKFSKVGFFGPLKTFKTQRQKVMFLCKSDFHWQSNAFLWFDFQTRGFI